MIDMLIYEYEWIEFNGVLSPRYDPPRLYSGTLAQVPATERLRMVEETGRNTVFELEDDES